MDNNAEHSTSDVLSSQALKVYSAVEASSDAIFIADIKGRIEYANQVFLKLHDWSEKSVIGRSISEIPYSKNIALNLVESLNKQSPWNMRHQIISPLSQANDSNLLWVRTSIDPIFEDLDKVSGYVGIQRVIEEEVSRELQIKKEFSKIMGIGIQQEKQLKQLKKSYDEVLQQNSISSTELTSESDLDDIEEQYEAGHDEKEIVEANLTTQPLQESERTATINRNTLNSIRSLQREGGPDILEKITGLYFENSCKIIDEIQEAVDQKDAKKIRSASHSLKSSSANLGADDLATLCNEMENLGKNNQLDEIDQKFIALKQQYNATCIALQSEIS